MKKFLLLAAAAMALGGAAPTPSYPDWAYGVPTPENEATAPRDDGTVYSLPGSDGRFTRSQISGALRWHGIGDIEA